VDNNIERGLGVLRYAAAALLLALLATLFSDALAGALGLIAVVVAVVSLWEMAPTNGSNADR
jgi:hypothetical protein